MTFSMSLLTVLRRTIGLKAFRELYDFLLGLGIMIVVDLLKCESQYLTSIQALAMLIMTLRHLSSLKIAFKWLHDNFSGPGADNLLQLASVILNSSFEKVGHNEMGFIENINIDLIIESHIECEVEGILEIINFEILTVVILNRFDSR